MAVAGRCHLHRVPLGSDHWRCVMAKIGYLVAKCGRCGAIWALDFEPDRCTCNEYSPHRDDDVVGPLAADDYTHAVAVAYPKSDADGQGGVRAVSDGA